MEHFLNAFSFLLIISTFHISLFPDGILCVNFANKKFSHNFINLPIIPYKHPPISYNPINNRGYEGKETGCTVDKFKLEGVPRLYGWMMENFSRVRTPLEDSEISRGVDYFYVDMNAVIHSATHGNLFPVLMMEDQQRMRRIVTAMLNTFKLVNPKKMMYIGVDGVCPSAKINQQRTRRFRLYKSSSSDNEYYKGENGEMKYKVNKLKVGAYDNVTFNPSYISPGTQFMSMMDSEIRNWIALQNYEGTWNDCYIVYSGTDVPGEGEHKIYDTIRKMVELDDNVKKSTHLVYGLDADLVMLSLITKLPKMYILREEHNFTPHILSKEKPNPYFSKETGLLHIHGKDYIDLKTNNYEVLSMNVLRRTMYSRCMRVSGTVKNDLNRFLFHPNSKNRLSDDFSLLSFMAGNDFLPHLPTVELCNSSFNDLINMYYKMLPKLRGFLTQTYKINTSRLQLLMKELCKNEFEYFKMKAMSEKISDYSDPKKYAKYYYENKCDIDFNNKKAIRKMCEQYIEGLFWTLSYYHLGCPSWNWCYKYHYAPLVSDLAKVSGTTIKFYKGEPITPLEHLLAITPPNNSQLLPPIYRSLSGPEGSLCQYFPEDFEICEDGKDNEWEHVVKLPFLDTKHLCEVARSVNDELKYNNLYKNKPGCVNVYHRRNDNNKKN
ncbi:XRN 5'-3' exonuclease N-terminus family protein [Theileria parva strain Muguga]|uniref:XRN 5'-3' exonuclease N-terminus family protein n=1 Tax=Theileria parva strain Muguga TaxID=333668 RepID=UPI001C617628|nr:XRN 5'-3' exonuclease N-terminus family protein [Theileria parva strain Muguga]EAN34080.2 XRN 5'-3' exonuclease N-terminus family protein [Theileria parva strain Muguga]